LQYIRLPSRRSKVKMLPTDAPSVVFLFKEECIELSKFVSTARDEMSAAVPPAEGLHLRYEKLDGSEKRRASCIDPSHFNICPEIAIDYKTKSITIATFGVEYDAADPHNERIFVLGLVKLNYDLITSLCDSLKHIESDMCNAEKKVAMRLCSTLTAPPLPPISQEQAVGE
jgi:hypothetical protein